MLFVCRGPSTTESWTSIHLKTERKKKKILLSEVSSIMHKWFICYFFFSFLDMLSLDTSASSNSVKRKCVLSSEKCLVQKGEQMPE